MISFSILYDVSTNLIYSYKMEKAVPFSRILLRTGQETQTNQNLEIVFWLIQVTYCLEFLYNCF